MPCRFYPASSAIILSNSRRNPKDCLYQKALLIASRNSTIGRMEMLEKNLIRIDRLTDSLFSALETRDVVLWIREIPKDTVSTAELVAFLGLPWRLIVSEEYNKEVIDAL